MGIKIAILNPDGLELCTQKAFTVLRDAFAQQNIKIHPCLYTEQLPQADLFIGAYEKSPMLRDLVAKEEIPLPLTPEAILIQELTIKGNTALWACAYDTRGLLYALYELAARINAQSVPALYQPVCERPAFKRRSILHLLPPAGLKRGLTFSPDSWRSYFEMLTRNRFNSFTLVLTSPSPTPVFPYFFVLPEHPEVNPRQISDELRAQNIQALQALAELAVEAGLDFQLGFWNFYSGHSSLPCQGLGLEKEKTGSYFYLALKQFLIHFPEISGLEFRFHSAPLAPEFGRQTIVQAVQDNGNRTGLTFYANQITADTLELLTTAGIDCALVNEGWGSKLGLAYPKDLGESDPFTAGGTGRITRVYQLPIPSQVPWGDPEYLSELLPALQDGGYDSLQLAVPTIASGEEKARFGEKQETPVHWEYERYWYQLHLCGRLAYHPGTNGAVLIRDFHRRFGEKGNDLAALYQLTGKVLPLFNTFHGETASGPELTTGGLLPFYLRRPTADPALFADCREYVHAALNRAALAKLAPPTVADELDRLGREIIEKVQTLQGVTLNAGNRFAAEWEETLLRAELAGRFALYHSTKIKAAIELAFFSETKDFNCLERALAFLKEARFSWEKLPFTVRLPEQRLLLLEDEQRVETLLKEYRTRGNFLVGFDFGGLPAAPSQEINRRVFPDYYVEDGFNFVDPRTSYDPERGYGWLNSTGLQATPAPAVRLGEHDLRLTKETDTNQLFPYGNLLLNKLIWSQTPATFQVDLSPGTYQIQLTFCDRSPTPRRHGPMQIAINEQVIVTDLVIAPGQRVDLRETVEVTAGKINLTFSCRPNYTWFISALTIHPVPPLITHNPITAWERGKPLTIRATVTGINPIGQVILNYQTENERGYHMVMMTPVATDQFVATIPAVYLEQGELINYYITAMDNGGKKGSLGSFDYPLTVNIRNTGDYTPAVFHFPPGPEEKTLKLTVRPASQVEKVILYYKNSDDKINQVTLEQENAEDQYGIALSRLEQLPDGGTTYRFAVKFKDGKLALFPNPLTAVPYFLLKTGAN